MIIRISPEKLYDLSEVAAVGLYTFYKNPTSLRSLCASRPRRGQILIGHKLKKTTDLKEVVHKKYLCDKCLHRKVNQWVWIVIFLIVP